MESIRRKSPCPICHTPLDTEFRSEDNRVFLDRTCDEHGEFSTPFFKDKELLDRLMATASKDRIAYRGPCPQWAPFRPFVTTIAVDVTNRCNLFCPNCFSVSGAQKEAEDELSVEEIRDLLPDLGPKDFRPNVSLVGGESLLREDLPDILRAIHEKGYTARLNSNGVGLLDDGMIKRLKKENLGWVILQFDGFSPRTSVHFRGRDLVDHKLAVIEKLAFYGINVHLAVMLEKGKNLHEFHDILAYASRTPNVLRASFFPRSLVGRNIEAGQDPTYLVDLLESLQQHSEGRICIDDVFAQRRIWNRLFKLTGNPLFRTRICILPLVLVPEGDSYLPLNRLWKPTSRSALRAMARALLGLSKVARFDKGRFGDHFLLVNIEKFFDTESFLFEDALNCHHVYLTREGFVPFCYRNSFGRKAIC